MANTPRISKHAAQVDQGLGRARVTWNTLAWTCLKSAQLEQHRRRVGEAVRQREHGLAMKAGRGVGFRAAPGRLGPARLSSSNRLPFRMRSITGDATAFRLGHAGLDEVRDRLQAGGGGLPGAGPAGAATTPRRTGQRPAGAGEEGQRTQPVAIGVRACGRAELGVALRRSRRCAGPAARRRSQP